MGPDGGVHERVVRVVPDVSGLDAEFDYLVPAPLSDGIEVGTIVRVDLQNRRVRAWVVDVDVTPPEGVKLRPITKVTGVGPRAGTIDLAGWAARRWAGKRSFFLQTASPERVVRPADVERRQRPAPSTSNEPAPLPEWWAPGTTVLRLPPAGSPLDVVLQADAIGPVLVIVPGERTAETLVRKLRSLGRRAVLHADDWAGAARGDATVVGTRAAVWSPMPEPAAIIVLDAHDEALQSEASPTWRAVDIAVERARRSGVPCLLTSPTPRLEDLYVHDRRLVTVGRDEERRGWAPLHIVDLRKSDPRSGIYPPMVVQLLRSSKRVVCVVNRKGRAQLLVCTTCDEISRCERCDGAMRSDSDATVLQCRRCRHAQPVICRSCGTTAVKQLRLGVSRIREELESLGNRPVGEVTGDTKGLPDAAVLIGTEAVLHRVNRADAIVFLDFDQELMATRYRAGEDALVLLARAARIVGGRSREGLVVVQTRQPDHPAVEAALHADPDRFVEYERSAREEMRWPPYRALARVSGTAAAPYVAQLPPTVIALGPLDGSWIVQAPDHDVLSAALTATKRPPGGRLRVEVDPPRL